MALAAEKTLYIHLGAHKTGSTSLQKFLRRNADALAQNDVFVPDAGTYGPEGGHHNLAWQLRNDSRYNPAFGGLDVICKQLGQAPQATAIISSEDFCHLVDHPRARMRLEAAIRGCGYKVHYLLYHRNPRDYAASLYITLRKSGVRRAFDAYVTELLTTGKFRCFDGWVFYADPGVFLRDWQTTAPVTLQSYDDCRTDLIANFCDQIGAGHAFRDGALEPVRRFENRNNRLLNAYYRYRCSAIMRESNRAQPIDGEKRLLI